MQPNAALEAPTVRIELRVPEEWFSEVSRHGVPPSRLAEYVVLTADVRAALRSFRKQLGSGRTFRPTARASASGGAPCIRDLAASSTAIGPARPPSLLLSTGQEWVEETTQMFLDLVRDKKDFQEPLALLSAYMILGPDPTSGELQTLCGFGNASIWALQLRAAKARLTIQAKRMGLPAIFGHAQPSRGGRRHPLDPAFYHWAKRSLSGSSIGLPKPEHWGLREPIAETRSLHGRSRPR